jgi:hypothetical protein
MKLHDKDVRIFFALTACIAAVVFLTCVHTQPKLKDVYKNDFLVGVALHTAQVDGKDTRATLLARMRDHILAIIGPDYTEKAFEYAHEADPGAELYYNDFTLYKPAKRRGVVQLARNLQVKKLRLDGIGMQGHYQIDYPPVADITRNFELRKELDPYTTALPDSVQDQLAGEGKNELSPSVRPQRTIKAGVRCCHP